MGSLLGIALLLLPFFSHGKSSEAPHAAMKKILNCYQTHHLDANFTPCIEDVFQGGRTKSERIRRSTAFFPLTKNIESLRDCTAKERKLISSLEKSDHVFCFSFTDALNGKRFGYVVSDDGQTILSMNAL